MKQEEENAVAGIGPPPSEHPMLDGCCQSYTNKTLSASLQRDEAKAVSDSNEGDDRPTCIDRSLGRTTQISILIQPPSLPPTRLDILTCKMEVVVQRNADVGFAQVPIVSEQTIEQTLNRHTKISGDIIGISLRPAAVQKWMLTAHQRAALIRSCQEQAGVNHSSGHLHEEWHTIRLKADKMMVQDVTWLAQTLKRQTWLLPGLGPRWLQQS